MGDRRFLDVAGTNPTSRSRAAAILSRVRRETLGASAFSTRETICWVVPASWAN